MSDRLLPQRWVDAQQGPEFPPNGYPDPVPLEGSDSVLKVALEFVALVRRHLLLVAIFVALSLAGLSTLLYKEQPQYRAGAVIRLADKARATTGGLGGAVSDQMGGSITDPILSQLQVLQS